MSSALRKENEILETVDGMGLEIFMFESCSKNEVHSQNFGAHLRNALRRTRTNFLLLDYSSSIYGATKMSYFWFLWNSTYNWRKKLEK